MFSFFKRKKAPPVEVTPSPQPLPPTAEPPAPASEASPAAAPAVAAAAAAPLPGGSLIGSALVIPIDIPVPGATPPERQRWVDKLKAGLGKTASSISGVFGGSVIDEALYENLEDALLMADAGVPATQFLIAELRRKVKDSGITHPIALKNVLVQLLTDMLTPLQKPLVIGEHSPTVLMVAGVNGAGKTTSIGKLTRHLSEAGESVLLAAADTFRAAAREQLGVWADRNLVDIVSQDGADPAAVCFDAVSAGKARGKDVVLIDTAGRLPTQLHLMEELKKIKRVIQKADPGDAGPPQGAGAPAGGSAANAVASVGAHKSRDAGPPQGAAAPSGGSAANPVASVGARKSAPHEVLLVIDGNTGQNALMQVRAFDDALQLTGLIITKLDGTAKGGVIAAIARERPVPVYFIGVGEKLEDLETFNAREFAQALLG